MSKSESKSLANSIAQAEIQLAHAKLNHAAGRLENTSELRQVRRQLAKLLTSARQEEIAKGLAKGSLSSGGAATGASESGSSAGRGQFLKGVVDKLSTT